MTIEERKLERRDRLAKLNEAINNLPEVDSKKVQGQMDVTTFDIIQQSKKRDDATRKAFADKFKETREFVKAQDKATGASKEDASENRLFLDEDLFKDETTPVNLKESKSTLTESADRDFDWGDPLWAVVKDDGTFAGNPCLSWEEAQELAFQHKGSHIYKMSLDDGGKYFSGKHEWRAE